ncbi:DUF4365 domain-containing protein [Algoriphagus yeomjeoni]|uniref:Uncharacterized protein DUF4365 n=1 Tax=Algoriphagus yeomjeoni TaxID=291403 RepID=A0A327PQP8_9BACT|nr:DUF4365 and DUF1817 domain-containing protein [Algoriphagus yeomjeoni]RAI91986.1 uncharacterized protein DUF4365 [Algoriphagus yeomjeoni]
MNLPKYKRSNQTGRKGLNKLKGIVEEQLEWILRPSHQEDDFGIDGYIDIIDGESVTGKSIAFQVKTGQSYLVELDENHWLFRDTFEHLNYYLNHDIPVLVILVDDVENVAYWEICKAEFTNRTGNSWTMPIPKSQHLNAESKEILKNYVSSNVDYASQLENYWDGNKLLTDSGHILLIAGKDDIKNLNYQPFIEFLNRACSNKQLLIHLCEKVEIGIHGYDYEKRELYEIEEVKHWITQIFSMVPGLTYFLVNHERAQFLKLFMFCRIDFEVVPNSETQDGKLIKQKVEFDSKQLVKIFEIIFNDLNDFTEAFKIALKVNERVSKNIMSCLTGVDWETIKKKDNSM